MALTGCPACGEDKGHTPDCSFGGGVTSAKGTQDAGKQAYRPILVLSDDEMADLVSKAEEWTKDPSTLSDWALKNYLVVAQLVAKIATTIPGGRGGPNAMLRAAKMYGEFAERAMQLAAQAQEKEKK